jgi:hypothetical protein
VFVAVLPDVFDAATFLWSLAACSVRTVSLVSGAVIAGVVCVFGALVCLRVAKHVRSPAVVRGSSVVLYSAAAAFVGRGALELQRAGFLR